MRWRKLNTILHRDIGYLSIGMTVIYAISGIAVNHVQNWNPNYSIETKEYKIPYSNKISEEEYILSVLNQIGPDVREESRFRPRPGLLQIFFGGNTIQIDFKTGTVTKELVSQRSVFFDFNFLHLNHAKRLWTYVADLYAVALFMLALTGMLVLPGKKGIKGRGALLTVTGAMIPLFFLIIYKYL